MLKKEKKKKMVKSKGKNRGSLLSKMETWKKGAISGGLWGVISLILGAWYGGSPFLLTHFWQWNFSTQLQYILFFPFHAIALIFPEDVAIHTIALILTPVLVGAGIGIGIAYLVGVFRE